jgi:hypothetical protein
MGAALTGSLGAQYCPYETLRRYERAIERGLESSMRQFREAQKLRGLRKPPVEEEPVRDESLYRFYQYLLRGERVAMRELREARAAAEAAGVKLPRSTILDKFAAEDECRRRLDESQVITEPRVGSRSAAEGGGVARPRAQETAGPKEEAPAEAAAHAQAGAVAEADGEVEAKEKKEKEKKEEDKAVLAMDMEELAATSRSHGFARSLEDARRELEDAERGRGDSPEEEWARRKGRGVRGE